MAVGMGRQDEARMDDAGLIRQAQEGEVEAFGELYRRYIDVIYRYLRARVGNDHDAEDIAETVFLRAFESLERYEERGWPFSAYLYRVAKNALADHYRRQVDTSPVDAILGLADGRPSIDDDLEVAEQLDSIRAALSELPDEYQEVIHLRVALALPTKTVAEWMNRSEVSVRVLLHRALKDLRLKVRQAYETTD